MRDVHVLRLSAAEARHLRDRLARSQISVDVDAPEGTVRVPARENRDVSLASLLESLRRWASAAGIGELPIAYGAARPHVLVVSATTRLTPSGAGPLPDASPAPARASGDLARAGRVGAPALVRSGPPPR